MGKISFHLQVPALPMQLTDVVLADSQPTQQASVQADSPVEHSRKVRQTARDDLKIVSIDGPGEIRYGTAVHPCFA
jgi:hypothetical protein